DPGNVGSYGPVESEDGAQTWTVKVLGESKGTVTALLKGVTDRNQAEALKGIKLYVDRARLPPAETGSYYHADLIGLDVALTTGEKLGRVVAVHNFGAGDIIEVGAKGSGGTNETVLVPFSEAAIAEVDMKSGLIRVEPLPGLFDDGDADEAADVEMDEGDDDTPDDTTPVKRG
ncbi:MAG: 16S rRNA processing protein RimM, partial [Rhodospirillaceae bacterium]|nr:16S rRNA processing protein RimM [Rhodospirillaceae bacterium]